MQNSGDRSTEVQSSTSESTKGEERETSSLYVTSKMIASLISKQKGIPQDMVRAVIDDCFIVMSQSLLDGYRVKIQDFGTFKMKHDKTYIGNRSIVFFRMGKTLKMLAGDERGKHSS
mgnify:FL=1